MGLKKNESILFTGYDSAACLIVRRCCRECLWTWYQDSGGPYYQHLHCPRCGHRNRIFKMKIEESQ